MMTGTSICPVLRAISRAASRSRSMVMEFFVTTQRAQDELRRAVGVGDQPEPHRLLQRLVSVEFVLGRVEIQARAGLARMGFYQGLSFELQGGEPLRSCAEGFQPARCGPALGLQSIPTPPPRRPRGRPVFCPERLFVKALVIMIVRRLHERWASCSRRTHSRDEERTRTPPRGRTLPQSRRTFERRLSSPCPRRCPRRRASCS
jgi:hypothetical protein